MTLAEFYAAIAPFLEGRTRHADAVRALWGDEPPHADAERLAIYGRFCSIHRFEAVDQLFEESRAAVIALGGEEMWRALVEGYFAAHPMHHWEINENGGAMPLYLRTQAVPAWIAELAELEWWYWKTRTAPDDPRDQKAGEGPLRIASTVELRPFSHDLVEWLDADGSRPPAPRAAERIVIFWRDLDLRGRRENVTPRELACLKAVHEGAPAPHPETVDDLHAAGILLGQP